MVRKFAKHLEIELATDHNTSRFFIFGSAIALLGSIIGAFAKDVNTLIVAELVCRFRPDGRIALADFKDELSCIARKC